MIVLNPLFFVVTEEDEEETPEINLSEIVEKSTEEDTSAKEKEKSPPVRKEKSRLWVKSVRTVKETATTDEEVQVIAEKIQRPAKEMIKREREPLGREETSIVAVVLSKKRTYEQDAQTRRKTTSNEAVSSDDDTNVPSTSTGRREAQRKKLYTEPNKIVSLNGGSSDNETSFWTAKDEKPEYPCEYCNGLFPSLRHLKKHEVETCLYNPDSRTNKKKNGHRCEDCGRNYKYEKALRYHRKHECKFVVTCKDCGKSMQGPYVTERHKKNHCVKKQWSKREMMKSEMVELFSDESDMEL